MLQPLIVHFERISGGYSIERVFDTVRSSLRNHYSVQVVRCPIPSSSRFWLPMGIWRAKRIHADVMHIVGDVHYIALGLSKAKTILTIHDLNSLDRRRGLRRILYKWIYFTLPLRRCRFVTAISNHTRDQLIIRFPKLKVSIEVIPDPVPPGFSTRLKAFNTYEPRILQIGTAEHKNLLRLAEALQGMRCSLQIIGRLNEGQRLALRRFGISYRNAADVSDVELIQLYDQSDIVAFVSLAEGFGMPIIEGQAIGRPVLTSNLAPMNEVAGAGACLVDPYSVPDIRNALTRIIENAAYRKTLIDAGSENVRRFSPQIVAQKYSALYDRVETSFRA